jgi:thiamine biosynthesis lipoprotein
MAACTRAPEPVHVQFLAFGTLNEITVVGAPEARAQRAAAAVEQLFNQQHRDWHAWQAGALTRINANIARGEAAPVEPALGALIAEAKRLSLASEGLFNPALGKLFALWSWQGEERRAAPPTPDEIATVLAARPDMRAVHLVDGQLRSDKPTVQLDLGAIAKGHAAEAGANLLARMGIEHALIASAGDIRALGNAGGQPGGRPWRIGIRHPRRAGTLGSVELHDGESVSTSGDYERYFMHAGRRYHHLLDPRDGQPARGTQAVTVIHREGARADAAATALFIAGPGDFRRIAARMDIALALLVDDAGHVYLTPAMAARITLEPEVTLAAAP